MPHPRGEFDEPHMKWANEILGINEDGEPYPDHVLRVEGWTEEDGYADGVAEYRLDAGFVHDWYERPLKRVDDDFAY